MKVEVKLAMAILFEGWDFATDTMFLVKNVANATPEDKVCAVFSTVF